MTPIEASNAVLPLFTNKTSIEKRGPYVYVTWTIDKYGCEGLMTKRWMCRGTDFYPVWYRKWGGGGTSVTALAQLVRWVQGKPVLPFSTWRFWMSPTCLLGRDNGPKILEILQSASYPDKVPCVLCGNVLEGGLDWWSLKGVTGPCCGWTTGCRQQVKH